MSANEPVDDKSRIRDLLSSYYGDLDGVTTVSNGHSGSSASTKLHTVPVKKKIAQIDMHDFDALLYMTKLTRSYKFNSLMSHHNKVTNIIILCV